MSSSPRRRRITAKKRPKTLSPKTPTTIHALAQRAVSPVFGANDYASNNGMLTAIWGPATWHLLHCMSFNYPVDPSPSQKSQYRDFVLSLQHVLPCGKCRQNLVKNFATLPLEDRHLASRAAFSRYIYDLHEVVNTMLHKKSGLTYADVRETYEHFRARCATPATPAVAGGKARKHDEKGCVVPLNGHRKTKCVLRIVPQTRKCKTFSVSK